jgi:hypothetical protein
LVLGSVSLNLKQPELEAISHPYLLLRLSKRGAKITPSFPSLHDVEPNLTKNATLTGIKPFIFEEKMLLTTLLLNAER